MVADFLPPEAILWKGDEDTTMAVRVWVKQTHPGAKVEMVDSMVGPLLKIDLAAYGFQARPGQIVMKDPNNGLYSAIPLEQYQQTYMS